MGAWASVSSILKLIAYHPDLAMHHIRSRVRLRQVASEQKRGDGYSARPLGLTLKPVLSCNLRCSMCSFVATGAVTASPKDSLSLDVWQSAVDDAQAWGSYIWLTGGEPTLYPHVLELVEHTKRRGLLCGMTTNGTMLNKLAEALVDAPLDILVVSVDGPEDVHNAVRGHGHAFERTARGLAAIHEARARSRRRKPLIVANCSLSPGNYLRAREVVKVAEELGVDALSVQHLWMLTRSMIREHNSKWGKQHSVSEEDGVAEEESGVAGSAVVDLIRQLRNGRSRVPILVHPDLEPHEILVYYAHPATFVRRGPTVCAWVNTDILPNGDVSPCFDLVCGNITQERLRDIWNNEAFRRHRQRLGVEGDLPICARCCAYWRRN